MASRRTRPEKEVHSHIWGPSRDPSQQICFCGNILVSYLELQRRKNVWSDYFVKVRQTPAYRRFIAQKEAINRGDIATVKELAEEYRNNLQERTNYLPMPSFPDENWKGYVVAE